MIGGPLATIDVQSEILLAARRLGDIVPATARLTFSHQGVWAEEPNFCPNGLGTAGN
jgi:hypothetical protein